MTDTIGIEAIEYLRKTPSGFVTDGMSRIGLRGSMIGIRPVSPMPGRSIAGRAVTVRVAPIRGTKKPAHNFYSILRSCKPGDIMVVECRRPDFFMLGENVIHHALRNGVQAIILDGGARDVAEIAEMGFPLYFTGPGLRSYSILSEIVDVNVPITCAEAQVYPGDIIHGDTDGVNVIPAEALEKVMESVRHVAAVEEEQAAAIAADVPLEELYRVMAKKK